MLERQISKLGGQSIGVTADVSKCADLEKLVDAAVERFGRLSVVRIPPIAPIQSMCYQESQGKQIRFSNHIAITPAFCETQIVFFCRWRLIAKHSPRVLDPHLVTNAGFGQPHELSERCTRPAGAAGQRRDQARDRGIAVPVERAQVNVPSGATGGQRAIGNGAGPRAPRRSSARTARAFAGIGVRSRRRLGARRPEAPARRSRVWRRPQRQPWLSAQLPSFGG
jgi:NAD(P)-dependent dehydrogenase (short-subunit alcohol dehydrogenase family)